MSVHNLLNKTFNSLTVLSRETNDRHNKSQWLCACVCGNLKIVGAAQLIRNKTLSCGCLRKAFPNLKSRTRSKHNITEYLSKCDRCYKEKWSRAANVHSLCVSCSSKINNSKAGPSEDFVIVEHKAMGRKPQLVKKFRKLCSKCSKDCGYRFKGSFKYTCPSCSSKRRYVNNGKINDNFYSIRQHKQLPDGSIIYTRSSYESFYCDYLINSRISFKYEPQRFVFKDGSSYLPDFYLNEMSVYIELKGLMRESDLNKLNKMKTEYPEIRLIVLRLADLQKLGYKPNAQKRLKKAS